MFRAYVAIATLSMLVLDAAASDGELDPSFGNGGIVITAMPQGTGEARAIAIQGDGKIVVAGFVRKGESDFAIIRYNSGGSLDNGFGNGGVAAHNISSGNDEATALAIQPDGKILVAGASPNLNLYDAVVIRLNSDGTRDNAFATGGIFKTRLSLVAGFIPTLMAVQRDGKIVITAGSGNDIGVARLNPDGTLDAFFGSGGKATAAFPPHGNGASSIASQPDGRIVIGGGSSSGNNIRYALTRLTTNGLTDQSFGYSGKVLTDFTSQVEVVQALAIQKDRKILAAGFSDDGAQSQFTMTRYNRDGTLDNHFGGDGKIRLPSDSKINLALSVIVQADGRIVLGGMSRQSNNAFDPTKFAMARFRKNGALDNSFGDGGFVRTSVGVGNAVIYALAQQSDGAIVAAGHAQDQFGNQIALARFLSNDARFKAADNSRIFLNYRKPEKSFVKFSGTVPVSAGLTLSGAAVSVTVNRTGYSETFVLDEKGVARNQFSAFQLRPPRDGVAHFQLKLAFDPSAPANENLIARFEMLGGAGAVIASPGTPVDVVLSLSINGRPAMSADVQMLHTAVPGKFSDFRVDHFGKR